MGRIARRRRVGCKLACVIAESSRHRGVAGRVVALSEGGLAAVTGLQFEQGDPIRMLVRSDLGGRSVRVSGIIWNDQSPESSGTGSRLQRFGCFVSQPSNDYLAMLDRLAEQSSGPEPISIAVPRPRDIESERAEADLPRSREIQPPPKPEPEETLPYFRVRMKQIGGPRTRILMLRARSATQAEMLAHEELALVSKDSGLWGVLHISRVSSRR
jgi:hypothetical protein